jgi:hypothetical protein
MIAIGRASRSSLQTNVHHNLDGFDQAADYPAL